jgi:hypothetical protein
MFSALLLVLAGAAEPGVSEEFRRDTVPQAVDMLNGDCVKKNCAQGLTACNKDTDNCGSRLRCAFQTNADSGDIGKCWDKMTWATMSDAEVGIFNCAKNQDCARSEHFPGSFIDEEVKKRNLENFPGSLLEEEKDEADATEAEAMQEALHAQAAHMAKHQLYMNAVESLLQEAGKELATAQQGDNSEKQKAKIFHLLGALEASMDGLKGHQFGLEEDKKHLLHQHDELEGLADRVAEHAPPIHDAEEVGASLAELVKSASFLAEHAPPTHDAKAIGASLAELVKSVPGTQLRTAKHPTQ